MKKIYSPLTDLFDFNSHMNEMAGFSESTYTNKQALMDLCQSLEDNGIQSWLLIGGMAVWINGYQRSTSDIDILISKDDSSNVEYDLINKGFKIERQNDRNSDISLLVLTKGDARIDLIVAVEFYQKNILKRTQPEMKLKGHRIRYADLISLLEMKIKSLSSNSIIGNRLYTSPDASDITHLIQYGLDHSTLTRKDLEGLKRLALAYKMSQTLIDNLLDITKYN